MAANSILSFFPFLLLLMTLIRYVFHSQVMYGVVESLLRDYIPTGQEFVIRNLNAMVGRAPSGASVLAGHVADYFHRNFSAAGSCAESRLGISQQPLLPGTIS